MASELIEKIKVFYFLTLEFSKGRQREFAECCPRRRDGGLGWSFRMGAGEWIPGNM